MTSRADFHCRGCGASDVGVFVDLGTSPPANSFLDDASLDRPEAVWPLRAVVCRSCHLVQLDEVVDPRAIFSDYAYFSSFSADWLRHAEAFAEGAVPRFGLEAGGLVLEIASNDGYLLQHFRARGVRVLGIEPAANVAAAATEQGIPTRVEFFDRRLAASLVAEGVRPRLVVANNVLAHVPEVNDFVAGLALLLSDDGALSIEVPHLLRLIEGVEFDTIYHEHYYYYSLLALEVLFGRHGLAIVDVEQLATHGGSLRVTARHEGAGGPRSPAVDAVLRTERAAGLHAAAGYEGFDARVESVKEGLLGFLADATRNGKRVAGYGAPAKGNTLLNFCGIGTDLIPFTVDRNPGKQGRFLPGSRIPISAPERIEHERPDFVLILPWNLRDEITRQLAGIAAWGGRFVVPLPELAVIIP